MNIFVLQQCLDFRSEGSQKSSVLFITSGNNLYCAGNKCRHNDTIIFTNESSLTFRLLFTGQCGGSVDLVIAIPGSTVVPDSEFNTYEEGLIELLRYFHISPDNFNVGLVLYGEGAEAINYPQPFLLRVQVGRVYSPNAVYKF